MVTRAFRQLVGLQSQLAPPEGAPPWPAALLSLARSDAVASATPVVDSNRASISPAEKTGPPKPLPPFSMPSHRRSYLHAARGAARAAARRIGVRVRASPTARHGSRERPRRV